MTDAATFGAEWSASLRLGTDAELRRWLDVAQAACDEADTIARAHFRRDLHIETKPDRTFVTEADTAIEAAIRERIRRPSRTTASSARSTARKRAMPSVRWYIDPIDGTHNFMRGVPLFGTLAGRRAGWRAAGRRHVRAGLRQRWWAHGAAVAPGPATAATRRRGGSGLAA